MKKKTSCEIWKNCANNLASEIGEISTFNKKTRFGSYPCSINLKKKETMLCLMFALIFENKRSKEIFIELIIKNISSF